MLAFGFITRLVPWMLARSASVEAHGPLKFASVTVPLASCLLNSPPSADTLSETVASSSPDGMMVQASP